MLFIRFIYFFPSIEIIKVKNSRLMRQMWIIDEFDLFIGGRIIRFKFSATVFLCRVRSLLGSPVEKKNQWHQFHRHAQMCSSPRSTTVFKSISPRLQATSNFCSRHFPFHFNIFNIPISYRTLIDMVVCISSKILFNVETFSFFLSFSSNCQNKVTCNEYLN